MKYPTIPGMLSIAGSLMLSLSVLIATPQGAQAAPAGVPAQTGAETATAAHVTKVDYDDWHNRRRSHHRWGSHGHGDHGWHGRYRSHHRWGSHGHGDHGWHGRYRSHHRWGSHRW